MLYEVITSIYNLLKQSNNYVEDIKNNEIIHRHIEKNLSLLLTKNIKYASYNFV